MQPSDLHIESREYKRPKGRKPAGDRFTITLPKGEVTKIQQVIGEWERASDSTVDGDTITFTVSRLNPGQAVPDAFVLRAICDKYNSLDSPRPQTPVRPVPKRVNLHRWKR